MPRYGYIIYKHFPNKCVDLTLANPIKTNTSYILAILPPHGEKLTP